MHVLFIHLALPEHWGNIRGLAFRNGSETVVTTPRPQISDLDSLPTIHRDEPQQAGNGIKSAAMLASRGCLFDCSFCSIRQFYGNSQGALRRARSPRSVVEEMLALYTEKGVLYFSFQDDDFASRTRQQRLWLHEFIKELKLSGLAGRIRWKISCRVDDLEPDILEMMLEHGLVAVYLGVESGSAAGLRTLKKRTTVAQNLSAVDLLKRYDLAMAIGFMLFDPSSTIDSIRENIEFLRTVGSDGYFPINFCKMLPYAGTPIEAELRSQGRLRGTVARPDYGFSDPRLDSYEYLVQQIFSRRNFDSQGIVALFQQADFSRRLGRSLGHSEPEGYGQTLNGIISRTNLLALETLESLLNEVAARGIDFLLEEQETLLAISEREWRGEMQAEIEFRKLNMHPP